MFQFIRSLDTKHRGFGFVTYASPADAQDAIDNMDLNELNGRVLKVSLARPLKAPLQGLGNRAGMYTVFSGVDLHSSCRSMGIRGMVKAICKTSFAQWWYVPFQSSSDIIYSVDI